MRRPTPRPPTELQLRTAAAAAQILHRITDEGSLTVEEALGRVSERVEAFRRRVPTTPQEAASSAGLLDWSTQYHRNRQIEGMTVNELEGAYSRTKDFNWPKLDAAAEALSLVDVRDAIRLAVGNPHDDRDVRYRGGLVLRDDNIGAAFEALRGLVSSCDYRGHRILSSTDIADALTIGEGEEVQDADGGGRTFDTLTGVPEFDDVVLQALAPYVSPVSELECRVGDQFWYWQFRDGQAVRTEGRHPIVVMYEQIFDKITAALAIDQPEVFEGRLRDALTEAATKGVGESAGEAAIDAYGNWLIEFLATEQANPAGEQVRQRSLQTLRRSAESFVPKKLVDPVEVLVAAAAGNGDIARVHAQGPAFTLPGG
jgi:hypothetical protein